AGARVRLRQAGVEPRSAGLRFDSAFEGPDTGGQIAAPRFDVGDAKPQLPPTPVSSERAAIKTGRFGPVPLGFGVDGPGGDAGLRAQQAGEERNDSRQNKRTNTHLRHFLLFVIHTSQAKRPIVTSSDPIKA